ncbi:related to atp synthase epsilon chain, mitochondrial [Sporisorium reilianum SRZ2]|uniref:Related to atp synthase epsilon chain, mitochondrial n=4 Tax=Ustilaginaceae TaxID=5268 RepID=E6ZRN9_SPORE|nr:related to atp synthase epsilon chain, mitochondrial [Sporisorium reilianum SRZ2]CDI55958.1 related to atp synthase epsilon chain, mitochondrial [Melanopsichium pennsylvanicum 4]SJX65541.1 related to atp synthase epsilon chain, mitochondrial [Sporisorium reilianum f. sp. reilianum]SNX86695.1 related to atp synthase epsilon chain, mitochondrial [Melanopsichium pennsylvanicum]
MSAASWRAHFTFNKYTAICARATRQALKEEERAAAERRGYMALRYQEWKDGKASDNLNLAEEKKQ